MGFGFLRPVDYDNYRKTDISINEKLDFNGDVLVFHYDQSCRPVTGRKGRN
jgi:hypothetical protein